MLASVAGFEWRYQLRSPVFWVGFALFFLLAFGAVASDSIQIGSTGNVNKNAPFAIVQMLGIMSIFAMFIVTAMVAGTVVRDDETGFAPILYSTRIDKGRYLVGRFGGSLAAALLVMASVPLGIAVGSAMPWQDAEKIGPFVLGHYLWALFAFALPTLLIVGAMFFALATATRSMMWTYVGAVCALVLFTGMGIWLRDQQNDVTAALADPFGLAALSITTKYWTAAERNTQLPPLAGLLLANRVLWTVVAAALFALAWRLFRFEARSRSSAGAAKAMPEDDGAKPKPLAVAPSAAASRRVSAFDQLRALSRFDMGFVFMSPAFFVLLFIGVMNGGLSSWFVGGFYGSVSYPATRLMVEALRGAFTIMPIIIAIYYAGELVWRDRERRMHEIVDATAAPDWTHLVPKIAAITLVLLASVLVSVATGMLIQLLKGYTRFELGHYLLWYVLPTTVVAVHLAVLSVFVQVLVAQKFVGWGVMLVYLVASIALASAGYEHKLYSYADSTPLPLSDMNGMARFWIGHYVVLAYWSAFALILAVLAYALWPRGVRAPLRVRLAVLPRRLRGGALVLGLAGLIAWIGLGAFAYLNTNVYNRYLTQPQLDEWTAAFEKRFLRYETLPLPRIVDVKLDVQLYPSQARAVTTGRYRMVNRAGAPIEQLHVQWPRLLKIDQLEIDRATLDQRFDDEFPYRIYRLEPPMQPGEERELRFATTLEERGFPNGAPLTRIVANGTFVNNGEITPTVGMSRDDLLKDRAKRRKHGLPVDLRPPTLEDESGRERSLFGAASDWVSAEITVTTDADQTPIAPGYTMSDTVNGGRRTATFKPDAPINHFFSIQSARYEVRRDKAGDLDLAVYYHPGHEYNVERMLEAMKVSLSMFGEKFSPYQFRQARILEFPSYANFAQSFANTIPYSENIGFLTRLAREDDKIDVVTYVTAHEIAHQWWGHQLVPSWQQGATMLVESFAQYSALLVMEKVYGREQMRKFLKYELDRYLRTRGGEPVEELPLARVEDQPYIHYQKGSLALYWAKEVIGEDKVNRALSKLLARFAFQPAPYPNTLDFLRLLRAEAGPEHDALITDLFEKITLVDVKASQAKATKRSDGRWDVSFEVEARKLYADGQGKETEAPLDEPFDIGVFSAEPGRRGYSAASVLLFERRPVKTGKQMVMLVVEGEPKFVGVDPYNKRIDRNSGDNVVAVAR